MSGATEPYLSMYSDNDGPWAYSVTTNGVADWESASITRTVQTPLTWTSAATLAAEATAELLVARQFRAQQP